LFGHFHEHEYACLIDTEIMHTPHIMVLCFVGVLHYYFLDNTFSLRTLLCLYSMLSQHLGEKNTMYLATWFSHNLTYQGKTIITLIFLTCPIWVIAPNSIINVGIPSHHVMDFLYLTELGQTISWPFWRWPMYHLCYMQVM